MIKKIITAIFLTISIANASTPIDCFLWEEGYRFKGIKITKYLCEGQYDEVTIPSEIKGKSVTSIGGWAFAQTKFKKVIFPEGIRLIDDFAFWLGELEAVNLPNSLVEIGWQAFRENNIKSISFGSGLKEIHGHAFQWNQLTHLEIPDTVKIIKQTAFASNKLAYVKLPNGLKRIEHDVFSGNELTSVDIPASVEFIDSDAFFNNKIEHFVFPETVKVVLSGNISFNPVKTVTIGSNVKVEMGVMKRNNTFVRAYLDNQSKGGTYEQVQPYVWEIE